MSFGCLLIFSWSSLDFLLNFYWSSIGFLLDFYWVSLGRLLEFFWISMGFILDVHWIPLDLYLISIGYLLISRGALWVLGPQGFWSPNPGFWAMIVCGIIVVQLLCKSK